MSRYAQTIVTDFVVKLSLSQTMYLIYLSRYAQNTFANFTQNFSPRLQHANALTK